MTAADPGENGRARPRIMIVDDDGAMRSLIRMTLPLMDAEIAEAGDGREALELAGRARPDLVLLDWRMPGRSGADVLAELKRRYRDLPVIVLTGETGALQRALAESLGADTFVTKPFSPLALLETIERLLAEQPVSAAESAS